MVNLLKLLKVVLVVMFIWTFIGCIIYAYFLLTGGIGGPYLIERIGMIVGMANSMLPTYLVLLVPVTTVFFAKLIPSEKYKPIYATVIIIGLVLTGIFAIPFFAVPIAIPQTDAQFQSNYGDQWNVFPAEVQSEFLITPHELYLQYYGRPAADASKCGISRNNIFKKTSEFTLEYDIYYPKIPTYVNNATVIYIHGGGWMSGEKNQQTLNCKEMASQGYVVFAIEYRLLDSKLLNASLEVQFDLGDFELPTMGDSGRTGAYTLTDQITDIGDFTHYIANPSNNKFGANLDKVYFMGGSAGAHLAGVCGFGYTNSYFGSTFNQNLKIIGVILFYPPNDADYFFYSEHRMFYEAGFVPYTPEENPDYYKYHTPSYLVDENSPACILLHGTVDSMVPYSGSLTIQAKMQENNRKCILVPGYFGGHGHNVGVQHSIITSYYIERFMYYTTTSA